MAVPIMIPSSGELGTEITLVRWLARPGEEIASGTLVAEIEADKGVLEIEAPAAGTLLVRLVEEGSTVAPGTTLGYLGAPGERPPAPGGLGDGGGPAGANTGGTGGRSMAGRPAAEATGKGAGAGVGRTAGHRVPAAPATRRRAATRGVDLASVVPTGAPATRGGTDRVVTLRDVEAAPGGLPSEARQSPGATSPLRPLSANQRAVAAQVSLSHREIPPAHFRLSVDARRAVALAARGIGYTALFVHAAAKVLERFPRFRDALRGEQLVTAPGLHVAFAVGLEATGELYTPVVRDAGGLGLAAVAARVRELAQAVRERRLSPENYRGGSFLVTNLGAFGVESFDPVIHPGHSAALAVGAVRPLPLGIAGAEPTIHTQPAITLTLAVDHRLINGVEAARALRFIKEVVERGGEEEGDDQGQDR